MNQSLANIMFLASFVLAIVAVLLDVKSSVKFIYFGVTEGNKLTRDKYGFIDTRKNLVLSAVSLVAVGVAGFYGVFANESLVAMVAGAMALVPAGLRGKAYFDNEKAMKEGREKQIKFLRELKAIALASGRADEIDALFQPQNVNLNKGGRTYYRLFGWIYSENTNIYEAIDEIQKRITDLSLQEESRWFPR